MVTSEIRLSIALVTRNRPESLERCLRSVRTQSVQPFEVIVSDDSDSTFAEMTQAVAQRWNCQYIKGPQRGLYANRNHVAKVCKGTHIRTMDDDHVLPDGYLAKCLQAISSDPSVIWTTGEIGFLDGEQVGYTEIAFQLSPSGVGELIKDPDNNWGIADGSTIYPREIFDKGYFMIENFGYGSWYLEYGIFLYYKGFISRSIPGILVEHYANKLTLERFDFNVFYSRLCASFAYNLFFRPNLKLTLRYFFSYLIRLMCHPKFYLRFIIELPKMIPQMILRWKK
jgi:glycosyltransferase involved in cell wall biosynthesis